MFDLYNTMIVQHRYLCSNCVFVRNTMLCVRCYFGIRFSRYSLDIEALMIVSRDTVVQLVPNNDAVSLMTFEPLNVTGTWKGFDLQVRCIQQNRQSIQVL